MVIRSMLIAVLTGLLLFNAPVKAAEGGKPDTSRGDKMIAAYFAAETKKLADRCLSEIKTIEDWKAKRETYRSQLLDMLGLAKLPAKTELKAQTTGRVEHEEFTVENVHFQSSPGLYVTGNLYIPKAKKKDGAAGQAAEKYPTILYVCGHGGVKKNNISYGNKTYYTHHGSWFARHGYVCLTIDSLQLGEIEGIHHGTYRYGMWWWINRGYTPAGVEAWNCIRALDYLETRSEVDKDRFGVTGRSGGGAYSWWIAAIDDRIKVAVPGAGITDLTNHVVDGVVEGHCDCMFMHNTHRWDYAQVAALVAPRPLLISNTDKDTIFPLDGVNRVHEHVRRIYKLHDAEKNLGLNIVEGPHKDSQELQLGAFIWFDRFLKKEERVIEKAAVKMLEPEQLRVFEKLPEDEKNTKIQESFVPMAEKIEPPKDKAEFERQREVWMKALREEVFAGWPSEAGALNLAEVPNVSRADEPAEDRDRGGVRFTTYSFRSQGWPISEPTDDTIGEVRLDLVLIHRVNIKKFDRVELRVLDDHGWTRYAYATGLKYVESSTDNDAPFNTVIDAAKKGDSAIVYFCPRGVGPTEWDQSEKKQVQHRRRFMLLGQTLDGTQAWDIRRAIRAVRQLPGMKDAALTLQSERTMAGNVLYASLFEDNIKQVELKHLKPTHRDGPIYMNISKHFAMPQAVVMAASRCPVKLEMAIDGDWSYLESAKKALGWDDKQLSITIAPPPAQAPPK